MHQAVFFPVTAVISLVATLDSGATMEVGLVGRDGVAGIAVLPGMSAMPCEAVVQVPGVAYRIDAERLRREAGGSEPLRAVIGEYVMSLLRKSMQMLLCQRFHSVKQRCVRRLVVLSELLGSPVVPLTHEQMAAALGARRPTITLALRSLERAGTIEEKRGRVTIRNRDALERAACECCRALMVEGTAGILV